MSCVLFAIHAACKHSGTCVDTSKLLEQLKAMPCEKRACEQTDKVSCACLRVVVSAGSGVCVWTPVAKDGFMKKG